MSNNRKQSPRKSASPQGIVHDWMASITDDAPCGPDLEYDPEFVVLGTRVATRAEAQYGDFVGSPEPVNWSDAERDCRRLMIRSKDLRLGVLFTRCRTRLGAAAGLAEGLALLAGWLTAFPELVHPQPGVDADRDAALEIRMNALQSLTDIDGLLSDVREIALTRSMATRLQVRDVERAFAHPRPADALAPESVTRQLEELRILQPAVLSGFDDARESLTAIEAWCREHLSLYSPDLSALKRLLCHVAGESGRRIVREVQPEPRDPDGSHSETDAVAGAPADADESEPAVASSPVISARPATALDRHGAQNLIREARQWFEQHEPSSPIPVLLRRAEQFVGRRYAEIVKAIPAELLAEWSSEG